MESTTRYAPVSCSFSDKICQECVPQQRFSQQNFVSRFIFHSIKNIDMQILWSLSVYCYVRLCSTVIQNKSIDLQEPGKNFTERAMRTKKNFQHWKNLLEHLVHFLNNCVEAFCNYCHYQECTTLIETLPSLYKRLLANLTLNYDLTASTTLAAHKIFHFLLYRKRKICVKKKKSFLRGNFKFSFFFM